MNNPPGMDIKDHKRRGEWAELRFLARATEFGLTVTRPWGNSLHYDLAVDSDGCMMRVQVKSCTTRLHNSYRVNLHGGKHHYKKDDFEFLAAYIIPLNLWYIVPSDAALVTRDRLCLTPSWPKAKYEPFREAWHLFKEKRCVADTSAADLCLRRGCKGRLAEETKIATASI